MPFFFRQCSKTVVFEFVQPPGSGGYFLHQAGQHGSRNLIEQGRFQLQFGEEPLMAMPV